MRAIDDVARMFLMIPWLEQHPGIQLKEAARQFNVSAARLRDELLELSMIGSDPEAIAAGRFEYLIDFEEHGDGSITVMASEYVDRPLALTPDRVLSLVVALRTLAELVDDDARPHVRSALAKLETMAGEGASRVQVQLSSGSQDVRRVLAEAVQDGCRLRLVYDGINRGITTTPVVDPARVLVRGGAAYLQAFDVGVEQWRTYKVERIAEVELLEDSVVDHGLVPEVPDDWFSGQGHASAVLDLAPSAHWLVEYDPVEDWQDLDDRIRRVRLPLVGAEYLTQRVLRLADAVTVVAPEAGAQEAVRRARGALAAYATLPGHDPASLVGVAADEEEQS